MKTVLIVEDEKLIRQGLKTMIMRSGVPVETVIECCNGEMALEILREQEIEVMFTDIRMPKMDGIELVQKMQSFEHVPLTVAVSGYDDFTYAVEMMRNGVREYLLKPIERDKIKEILFKLNEEIENRKEDEINQQKNGRLKAVRIVKNVIFRLPSAHNGKSLRPLPRCRKSGGGKNNPVYTFLPASAAFRNI